MLMFAGWRFATSDERIPGDNVTPDPHHPDFTHLRQIYFQVDPEYKGRFTVPTLYDYKQGKIVNNEVLSTPVYASANSSSIMQGLISLLLSQAKSYACFTQNSMIYFRENLGVLICFLRICKPRLRRQTTGHIMTSTMVSTKPVSLRKFCPSRLLLTY